jgi:hypothetical protein
LVANPGIQGVPSESIGKKVIIPKLKPSMRTQREASFKIEGSKLSNKMPKYIRELTKCGQEDFK